MKRFKHALFLATAASSTILSSAAFAQTSASNDGERALHGAGATSIQAVLVAELNCIGQDSPLGVIGTSTVPGSTQSIVLPNNLPTPSGTFNCRTTNLQPNFFARYIGTGSGAGRQAWRTLGAVDRTPAFLAGTAEPNPFAVWTKLEFAFSDAPVTDSELNTYHASQSFTTPTGTRTINTAGAAGAPIQFPKYVLPVALAYNPVYGSKAGVNFNFRINSAFPTSERQILQRNVGGLHMSRTTFCGVVNGTITNFNDAAFTADNGNLALRDTGDSTTRWNSDGVPVRLVGRVDRSGTTEIFSRAVAAQCGSNYVQPAETLPYNRTLPTASLPDFVSVRADTGLTPSSTQPEAGNSTSLRVGNTYYDNRPASPTFQQYVTVTGGSSSNPAAGATNGTGLFLVADGSGGVAAAINKAPDFASASDSAFMLNGKIGYISADFLNGATNDANLHAVALQNPNSGTYELPSAAAGTVAFGSIRPPQTNAAGTAYDANDGGAGNQRFTAIPTYLGGGTGLAARNNPFAWYNVLYNGGPLTGLADPASGYSITGTTQFLGYTCYAVDGSGDNVAGIKNFLGYNLNTVTTDSTGANRSGIFTGIGTTVPTSGLLARANIGALPANWVNAVNETFLNSADPRALNLYVRNTSATGCTGKSGA